MSDNKPGRWAPYSAEGRGPVDYACSMLHHNAVVTAACDALKEAWEHARANARREALEEAAALAAETRDKHHPACRCASCGCLEEIAAELRGLAGRGVSDPGYEAYPQGGDGLRLHVTPTESIDLPPCGIWRVWRDEGGAFRWSGTAPPWDPWGRVWTVVTGVEGIESVSAGG